MDADAVEAGAGAEAETGTLAEGAGVPSHIARALVSLTAVPAVFRVLGDYNELLMAERLAEAEVRGAQ